MGSGFRIRTKGGFAPRATCPLQGFMRLTAQTALAFPTALALMGEILLAYAPKVPKSDVFTRDGARLRRVPCTR